jgi:C4-dicarboxylate-specific signal transduction histidine kinase
MSEETREELIARVEQLEGRVREAERRRRALLHIMSDLHESNRRLADQRKAMIHIMDDLHETTQESESRERQLREKQEQLIQVGKLATLGELTTGIAHELNNPLNNIGLFVGNAIDEIERDVPDHATLLKGLEQASAQVLKATEIISHLRAFGRTAPTEFDRVDVDEVVERALGLMQEQLRLRQIAVERDLDPGPLVVDGNSIQLEQVFINLLTNARDALADADPKVITVVTRRAEDRVVLVFEDSGPGVPGGLEGRVFDPFFTTKDVGAGTGLGLSIAYGIIRDHGGTISLEGGPRRGASFRLELPLAAEDA